MMDDVNENPPISGDSPSALPDSHNKMNLDQEQNVSQSMCDKILLWNLTLQWNDVLCMTLI